MVKRRLLISLFLLLLLLTVYGVRASLLSRIPVAHSSDAPTPGNTPVMPGITPTATAAATPTAAAAVTSTGEPTATQTAAASPTPETTVKVSGDYVNLRSGPGTNYVPVGKLFIDELLNLMGRLDDNTWLYVKTSGGLEGWIESTWVDLGGIDVDTYPIQAASTCTEATVMVSGDLVNLRTGPGTNFSKVRVLAFDDPLVLLGRLEDNTWLNVRASDGQEGWVESTCVDLGWINLDYHYQPVKTSPPTETSVPEALPGVDGRWIDIDLSDQMLYAFEGNAVVASFLVSTGIDLYPTEPGQFHIDVKLRYSDMRGDDYLLKNVPYTMYYDGDFAIHGTFWHHNFGTQMSRGCVNMDVGDAEWLYNWASVGMLVNIHR